MRKPAPLLDSEPPVEPPAAPPATRPAAPTASAPTASAPNAPRIATLADAGRIIRAKRRSLDLRIDDAADFSGVSVDLLSRLENGKTGVSSVSLLKVLDALGLTMLIVDKRDPSAKSAELPPSAPTAADTR